VDLEGNGVEKEAGSTTPSICYSRCALDLHAVHFVAYSLSKLVVATLTGALVVLWFVHKHSHQVAAFQGVLVEIPGPADLQGTAAWP
jgi:hypothetical protein